MIFFLDKTNKAKEKTSRFLGYTKYPQGGGGNNKRPTTEVGTKMVNCHKLKGFY